MRVAGGSTTSDKEQYITDLPELGIKPVVIPLNLISFFFFIVPISFATKNASTVDKCVWMIVILTTNPSMTLTPQGSKVLGEKVKGPICACTTYKKRVGEP